MADVQEVLVEVIPSTIFVSETEESRISSRPGHFLIPRAGNANLRNQLSATVIPESDLHINFAKSWYGSPEVWRKWVAKLRPKHELVWRELGILDGLVISTCRFIRNETLLLEITKYWSPETNTFIFPWGEATVTLEDIRVLGGLPLLGCLARDNALPDEMQEDVNELERHRNIINHSRYKKMVFAAWAKHFLDIVPTDATGERIEHAAFLSMWLSMFVLRAAPFDVVSSHVFKISARLAHGQGVALAPVALASLYRGLSTLKQNISSRNEGIFVVGTPLNVLQLWVLERFPALRPETVSSLEGHHFPRAARWDSVKKWLDRTTVRGEFEAPTQFEWMPYRNTNFALLQHGWVFGDVIAQSKELQYFARCIHACELVGMHCTAMYHPHRVARQLGYDQDVPGPIACIHSCCKETWQRYDLDSQSIAFFVPEDPEPGITRNYMQWWKTGSVTDVSSHKRLNNQEGTSTSRG